MKKFNLIFALLISITINSFGQSLDSLAVIQPDSVDTIAFKEIIKEPIYNPARPKRYKIKSIELEGTNRNKSAVLIRSGLAEGDFIKIPSNQTSEAIKMLWESKLFTDVKLYIKKIEGNDVTLLFKFKETPQISKIKVVTIINLI